MASALASGFSIAVSLSVAALFFFMGWIITNYQLPYVPFTWIVYPAVSYVIAIGFNAGMQLITCNKLELGTIASISLVIPGAILAALLLCFLSFVTSPIEIAIQPSLRPQYGLIFAQAFYIFWACMFGEAFLSSLVVTC